MKLFKAFLTSFFCAFLVGTAGAATFNLFSPASGVLVGNPSTYVTSPATSANIISLFSGVCTGGTKYLSADGSCSVPAGTGVTSVALTMPSGLTVTGSPITSSGTLSVTTLLNGIVKGNGSGFTNATSADVISTWSGTCNSGTFLRADGACSTVGGTPGGSDTQIQYNNAGAFAGADMTWTTGSTTLTVGTAAAPTITTGVNAAGNGRTVTLKGGATGSSTGNGGNLSLQAGDGGTTSGNGGMASLLSGNATDGNGGQVNIASRNGTGTNRNGGTVTVTAGVGTGSGTNGSIFLNTNGLTQLKIDGSGAWLLSGGTVAGNSGDVLTSNGAGAAPTWVAPSGGASGANPTASAGLTAVNGVATTFLRSDGAPAISQSIAPTWTATHIFANTTAQEVLNNSGAGSDAKNWILRNNGSGSFAVSSSTDAAPATAIKNALVFDRTGTTVTNIAIGNNDNPSFSVNGVTSTPDSYSGTAAISGCTTAPTVSLTVKAFGRLVIAEVASGGSATCTSNSSGFSLSTSIPAALLPADSNNSVCSAIEALDAGTAITSGIASIGSGGTIFLSKLPSELWTSSGTKQIVRGFYCQYLR
jgi:hypothetical protein